MSEGAAAMLDAEEILARSRAVIPVREAGDWRVEPITRGGSDRAYWRLTAGVRQIIAMEYTTARPDNAAFVPVTRFLASLGVPVPEILALREDERLVWLEDLGSDDLWECRGAPWDTRRPLYVSALRAAAKLHAIGESRLAELGAPELQLCFDAALYRWEQGYFLEEFIAGWLGLREEAGSLRASAGFIELATGLGELPRTLVHRDLQSQNVIIRDGEAWLIDYQGLRPGLPEYDVASLLYDPYVVLAASEREELKRFYFSLRALPGSYVEWESLFHRCAAQRLMQALGAYGFLGLKKAKTAFLDHIPNALANLREVLDRAALLPELRPLLDKAPTPN